MKIQFFLLTFFIVTGCGVKKYLNLYDEVVEYKVVSIDEKLIPNYDVYHFKTKKSLGRILNIKGKEIDHIIGEKYSNRLCKIHSFLMVDSIFLRSNRSGLGGIYEDGELLIDLSKEASIKYYKICN